MSNWRILRRGESTNEGPSHGVLSPEHPLYSLLDNTEVFLPFSSEFQSLMLWTSMGQEGWNLKPTQLTVFFCSVSRMGSWKLQSHRVSIIFILDHMGRVCSLLFDRMLLCLLGRGPLLFKVRGFDSFDSKLKKKKCQPHTCRQHLRGIRVWMGTSEWNVMSSYLLLLKSRIFGKKRSCFNVIKTHYFFSKSHEGNLTLWISQFVYTVFYIVSQRDLGTTRVLDTNNSASKFVTIQIKKDGWQ